jgi:hypothetical protein
MTEREFTKWIDTETERRIDSSQALKERIYPAHVTRLALLRASDDSDRCTGQRSVIEI